LHRAKTPLTLAGHWIDGNPAQKPDLLIASDRDTFDERLEIWRITIAGHFSLKSQGIGHVLIAVDSVSKLSQSAPQFRFPASNNGDAYQGYGGRGENQEQS